MLKSSIELNMWQLARVLTEAKPLVKHGEWEQWLRDNADCSVRTAQDMIAAYKRFGKTPQLDGIGRSKIFKLLSLPKGAEDEFLGENDVSSMSARDIEQAVKKAKAEMQSELDHEREARKAAEKRAQDAENRPPEIPAGLTQELEESRKEIERLKETGSSAVEESRRVFAENSQLRQELHDKEAMLHEQQEDLERAQAELFAAKSAAAKGDAERAPSDQLTPEIFAGAVRQFIGTVARMPHMRVAFASMDNATKEEYSVLLETVEKWAKDSRTALETTGVEGTVI